TLPPDKKYSSPWEGMIARMRGDQKKAREYYTGAIDYHQKVLDQNADDLFARSDLALAYAALGRKDEAIRQAKRDVELAPLSHNALEAPVQMRGLAAAYARLAESEAAREELAKAVALRGGPDSGRLQYDPPGDGLRSEPKCV